MLIKFPLPPPTLPFSLRERSETLPVGAGVIKFPSEILLPLIKFIKFPSEILWLRKFYSPVREAKEGGLVVRVARP